MTNKIISILILNISLSAYASSPHKTRSWYRTLFSLWAGANLISQSQAITTNSSEILTQQITNYTPNQNLTHIPLPELKTLENYWEKNITSTHKVKKYRKWKALVLQLLVGEFGAMDLYLDSESTALIKIFYMFGCGSLSYVFYVVGNTINYHSDLCISLAHIFSLGPLTATAWWIVDFIRLAAADEIYGKKLS